MSGAAIIGGLIIWLMLGGWAFRRLGPDMPDDRSVLVGLGIACIVLAPFAAGVALAEIKWRTPKP